MSAPWERLLKDDEVEDLYQLARQVVLHQHRYEPLTASLAQGVLALIRDRQALEEIHAP